MKPNKKELSERKMADIAHSIDLHLAEKLRDREYRQKFFLAECSAEIAAQLIALRKRRNLKQGDVANLTGTKQPAISRYEQADYQSRSFSILQKIANVLDARIRVLIEPSEDVLGEYEDEQADSPEVAALKEILSARPSSMPEPEKKRPARLSSLFLDDDKSAASYKQVDRENSAAFHRLQPESLSARQWYHGSY
jgi:transcriptional regulator with XRE-family HTH domain